jgi:hypothetical protein
MSFLSMLQNDLRTLSLEARKKFPQIKEVPCLALNLSFIPSSHWFSSFYFYLLIMNIENV